MSDDTCTCEQCARKPLGEMTLGEMTQIVANYDDFTKPHRDMLWYLRGHRRPLSECPICHGMQDNCPECSKENPPEC